MKIGEENLQSLIWNELKELGVRLPKSKKKLNCRKDHVYYETHPDQVFGVLLSSQEWITVDCHGTPVPRFLAITSEYLLQHKHLEGLFRKVGSVTRQKELRKYIEKGGNLDNAQPHDVSSLLKQWFRELPEPVIPKCLQNIFIRCYQVEQQLSACLLACLLLPPDHLYTLQHTVYFFSNIAKNCSENKMNSYNLALIMAPNLLSSPHSSAEKANKLLEYHTGIIRLLIDNADQVGHFPSEIAEKLGYYSLVLQMENSEKYRDRLEKSDDILDEQPKAKKKRRSGTVQELVNGIRKFVTHGRVCVQPTSDISSNLPAPLVLTSNETYNIPVTRSASKRKVSNGFQVKEDNYNRPYQEMSSYEILNTIKKDDSSEITPGLSSSDMVSLSDIDSPTGMGYVPTPVIHTRRKSLRLLKNKQKKKISPSFSEERSRILVKNSNSFLNKIEQKEVCKRKSPDLYSIQELKEVPTLHCNNSCKIVQNPNNNTNTYMKKMHTDTVHCDTIHGKETINIENESKILKSYKNSEEKNKLIKQNSNKLSVKTNKHITQKKQILDEEHSMNKVGKISFSKSRSALDEFVPISKLKETSVLSNIQNVTKPFNKSSLRRGRPNTIKTGLRSPFHIKNNSDSIIHKNTDSYFQMYSSINEKSRCRSVPCCTDKIKETSTFEIFQEDESNHFNSNDENQKNDEHYSVKENIIKKCSTPKISENVFISQDSFLDNISKDSSDNTNHSNYNNDNNNRIYFSGHQISPVIRIKEEKENSTEFNESKSSSKSSSMSPINDSDQIDCFKTDFSSRDISYSLNSEKSVSKKNNSDSNTFEFHSIKNTNDSKKENCVSSEILDTQDSVQWVNASKYLSNCEVSTDDQVKRESIIQLRIKNAGMVQANVQRYNSIGSEVLGVTPNACRSRKIQSKGATPVRIPSIFKRNEFGTRSLYRSIKSSEKAHLATSGSVQRSISMNDRDHEFKIPTPVNSKKHLKTNEKSFNTTPYISESKISSSNKELYLTSNDRNKENLKNSSSSKCHSMRSSASPIDHCSHISVLNDSFGKAELNSFNFVDEWQMEM